MNQNPNPPSPVTATVSEPSPMPKRPEMYIVVYPEHDRWTPGTVWTLYERAEKAAGRVPGSVIVTIPAEDANRERGGEAEIDKEQARWQNAIRSECLAAMQSLPPAHRRNCDGGGCDSGDPLDVTLSEVRQALNAFQDYLYEHHATTPPKPSDPPKPEGWRSRATVGGPSASGYYVHIDGDWYLLRTGQWVRRCKWVDTTLCYWPTDTEARAALASAPPAP